MQLGEDDARAFAISTEAERLYDIAINDPERWHEAYAETVQSPSEIAARIAGDIAEAGILSDRRMREWIWSDCKQAAERNYDRRTQS